MYLVLSRILLIAALIPLFRIDAANTQAIPKFIQQGGSEGAIKERKNAWTVGIAGGLIDGTYMRFADELAKVLDDGDNLRILPMVSYYRQKSSPFRARNAGPSPTEDMQKSAARKSSPQAHSP